MRGEPLLNADARSRINALRGGGVDERGMRANARGAPIPGSPCVVHSSVLICGVGGLYVVPGAMLPAESQNRANVSKMTYAAQLMRQSQSYRRPFITISRTPFAIATASETTHAIDDRKAERAFISEVSVSSFWAVRALCRSVAYINTHTSDKLTALHLQT